MEDHPNCVLDWSSFYHAKSAEELTQSLWMTTMELEATRVRVQEELRARDDQLNQLKELLNEVISERNEAQNKCQLLLRQRIHHYRRRYKNHQTTTGPPHSGVSSVEDGPITNGGLSSSDCEESIVSSPPTETPVQLLPPPPVAAGGPEQELGFPVIPTKELPEKGKLLEAVMKAGPLLQNLLLAGPLPLWRQPPPPLDTYQIPTPPVVIPTPPSAHHLPHHESLQKVTHNDGGFIKKRVFSDESDSSTETKYQRFALN